MSDDVAVCIFVELSEHLLCREYQQDYLLLHWPAPLLACCHPSESAKCAPKMPVHRQHWMSRTAGHTADGQTQKDRQLSPALKALSQLSHEGSDGWIADLEKLHSRGSTNQRRPSLHRNGTPNMQKTGMHKAR